MSIYQYSSHLEFLQDAYEAKHSQDESFSYDKIAELCGLKSRTEARNLIKGIKSASTSQLSSLARIFGLDEDGKTYLICLAQFHEAAGKPVAYELFQKLISFQKAKSPASHPFREIEIATSVLHMTLLSFFDLEEAPSEVKEISRLLKGRYSEDQIENAIRELASVGYIRFDASRAKWVPLQKHIQKFDYNSNFFLKRFHQQSLAVAQDALETADKNERYLVGASFCINEKVFSRIVQKMNAFIENLMQLEGVAGRPDTVVQLNQQLIKMTVSGHAKSERGLGQQNATERGFDPIEKPVIA